MNDLVFLYLININSVIGKLEIPESHINIDYVTVKFHNCKPPASLGILDSTSMPPQFSGSLNDANYPKLSVPIFET